MGGAVQVADLALGAGTSTTAQLTADKEEQKRKKKKKSLAPCLSFLFAQRSGVCGRRDGTCRSVS